MNQRGIESTPIMVMVVAVVVAIIGGFLILSGSGPEEGGGELTLSNMVFCSEKPTAYMNYTKQPDNTYSKGEPIYIYLNVNNHEYNLHSDESFEIWLKFSFMWKIPGESFSQVPGSPLEFHENLPAAQDPDELFLNPRFLPKGENSQTGQYTLNIKVEDKLGEENATISGIFELVESQQ